MELTFLGTGTSFGVPMIGCNCKVCSSKDPKNSRTRASVWIKSDNSSFLIDTATELRLQAIKEKISSVDFVLLTHSHADHTHGIDDLRAFSFKRTIPVFGNKQTIDDVKNRFRYITGCQNSYTNKPHLEFIKISENRHISLDGKLLPKKNAGFSGKDIIIPVPVMHGNQMIFGYKINSLAYLTDCSYIPEPSWQLIKNLEILIIDGLRYKKHPTHFSIDEALEVIKISGCKKAYLTHIAHDIDHEKLRKELPANVEPAFDGLKLYF